MIRNLAALLPFASLLFASVLCVRQGAVAADPVIGLSPTRPDSGRYVQTDQGYMVPYSRMIPGTQVEYWMEPIPGGTFLLGSSPDSPQHEPDETPQIEVTVEPFWLGKYEVTWAEYKEFMKLYAVFKEFEARNVRPVTDENRADAITAPTELYDPSFTFEFGEDPQQPAVTMTQYAAKQYTKWLSGISGQQYRLPAEAEWEYACRAGTTTAYSFGDDPGQLDQYAWYLDNSGEMSGKVGQKLPNPWGLHDMHGNVWEWMLDEYFENGFQRLKSRKVTAAESIAWPTRLFPRVVRGGSWDDEADRCRSAARMPSHDTDWKGEDPNLPLSPWWFTSDPSRAVGFRLLRPLKQLPKDEMAKFWEADVEEIRFDVANRLEEGRGALGVVDPQLPVAVEELQQ